MGFIPSVQVWPCETYSFEAKYAKTSSRDPRCPKEIREATVVVVAAHTGVPSIDIPGLNSGALKVNWKQGESPIIKSSCYIHGIRDPSLHEEKNHYLLLPIQRLGSLMYCLENSS